MTILSIFLLISGMQLFAQQNSQLSTPVRVQREGFRPSKVKAKKPMIKSPQALRDDQQLVKQQQPEKSKWGYLVSYRLASDLQEQRSSKTLMHEIVAGISYRLARDLEFSASLSGNYDSEGSEVLVDGQHTESYMGDVSLGLSSRIDQFSWSVANEFPTSPYSRAEGYNSVTQGSISYGFNFFERRFSVVPGLLGYYIWNKYETSPTTLTTNKMGSVRATLLFSAKIWRGLSARTMVGVQSTRYADGSSDVAARNSIGLANTWKNLTMSIDFSNGTYADREETQIWFVDKYRRIVSLRLVMSF